MKKTNQQSDQKSKPGPLYNAFYQEDHTDIIFQYKLATQIRKLLPRGAKVYPDIRNTIGRLDGGDEFAFAMFSKRGRVIIVQKMRGNGKQKKKSS